MDLPLKYSLRELLTRAIAGDYTHDQLCELHRLVHGLARGYVRMRSRNRKLPLFLFGMSEEDIAHDCIADLFTRSEAGELVEISKYFNTHDVDPGSLPEEKLTAHLRTLVFSVACDNIFRMLNEADPALGKIIRNIKLSVQKSSQWTIETRFEDKVLLLRSHDNASHRDGVGSAHQLPVLSDEEIEPALYEAMANHRDMPAVMSCFARKLAHSDKACSSIPVITLAVIVKKGYEKNHVGEQGQDDAHSSIDMEELSAALDECSSSVVSLMKRHYIGCGKVTEQNYAKYAAAIENYFGQYRSPGSGIFSDDEASYFESLRKVMPSLSREEYTREHRPKFEYLAKQIKTCLRATISTL